MEISIDNLINSDTNSLVERLSLFIKMKENQTEISSSQISSWNTLIDILKEVFTKVNRHWEMLMEYPIPMSSGKRPDLILLNGNRVFVVEFKNRGNYKQSDLDQLRTYVSDIKLYHSYAAQFEIIPVLLLSGDKPTLQESDGTNIIWSKQFKSYLISKHVDFLEVSAKLFKQGHFKPIEGLLYYADNLGKEQLNTLPAIYTTKWDECENYLADLIRNSASTRRKSICFVVGGPGTGKTGLALRLAYQHDGLYLAKNKQLINYLSDALNGKVRFNTAHAFVKEYGHLTKKCPSNVVLIDEAQRLTDEHKTKEYFNIPLSEREIFLHLLNAMEWGVFVFFIGPGQELAFNESDNPVSWSPMLKKEFESIEIHTSNDFKINSPHSKNTSTPTLTLRSSIRSPSFPMYSEMVDDLLNLNSEDDLFAFREKIELLTTSHFHMRITRDLAIARMYCQDIYGSSPFSHVLCSSSKNYYKGKEYVKDFNLTNNIPIREFLRSNGHGYEISNLALNEFNLHGFDLHMPIVAWPLGFYWKEGWKHVVTKKQNSSSHIVHNTLRVLLTRGRDGCIIYLPKVWEFDGTYNMFRKLGIVELK